VADGRSAHEHGIRPRVERTIERVVNEGSELVASEREPLRVLVMSGEPPDPESRETSKVPPPDRTCADNENVKRARLATHDADCRS
jgi:hypothetical protein